MKVSNLLSQISKSFRSAFQLSRTVAPGLIALAGGMMFVGEAQALSSTTILSEDFEADGDDSWGGGSDTFGTYAGTNLSGSPHFGVPDSGSRYGHLVSPSFGAGTTGASVNGGPLVSQAVNLTPGHKYINFDGWLASWTVDNDYARFEAEFFDGNDGTGSSLGTIVLADGNSSAGVVDSVDHLGELGAAWTIHNWSRYTSSNSIPLGSQSVAIAYVGDATTTNGNDGYADNINITTTIPEPTSIILFSLGVLGHCSFRRRPTHDRSSTLPVVMPKG